MDYKPSNVIVECANIGKYFRVGSNIRWIFQHLNLDICQGTIFSILGPSGCGKTTLLKCIVGRLQVDRGLLRVFGGHPKPGHLVGYMPQDISLMDDLTVRETLWLFGRLGKMDKKRTRVRLEFMLSIMGMSQYIHMPFKKLSGGQQRRVAFAAALLNEAPLLILDEPTVGVDPILRQNIWAYLRSIVKQFSTTVIITTHYIEEARNSQMIGMLLDGRLLAVSTPDALLYAYKSSSLEDVFLKLSLEDAKDNGYAGDFKYFKPKNRRSILGSCRNFIRKSKRKFNRSYIESFDVVRLLELIKTNLLCFVRHPLVFIGVILLPAFIFMVIPYSLGGSLRNVKLAVINEDLGTLGHKFIKSIDSRFITLISYKDFKTGQTDVKYGSVFGALWVQRNYSAALQKRMLMPLLVSDETISQSTIYVSVDYKNPPFAAVIVSELNKAFKGFCNNAAEESSMNPNLGNFPIKFMEDSVENNNLMDFLTYFQPAFLLSLNYFLVSAALILFNVSMFEIGYYDRLYTTGVSALEIILSQVAYQMMMVIPQLVFAFPVIFGINGVDCQGSYSLVASLVIVNHLSGIFLGLLIGGISSSIHMAVAVFTVVVLLTLLTQGVFWPLEGADESVRIIFQMGPFAYPSLALRNIINKGWTFNHPEVLKGFFTSIIWNFICFFLSWLTFWLKK